MKIGIIGGDAAGMSAASKIKRELPHAEVKVYEQSEEVSYAACGLPYYISGVIEKDDSLRIRKPEAFRKSGIQVELNSKVTHLDEKTKTLRIEKAAKVIEESFDKIVIATGASPVVPPLNGVNLEGVFVLKTIEDANKIKNSVQGKKKVVIVGAGYIGMELVETFHLLGLETRVIEMAPRILPAFDQDITDPLHEYLVKEGILLHTGEKVLEIKGEGKVESILTDQGEYLADVVILSIGVRPNTGFVPETIAKLGNGAIVVDEKMQTNIQDIYAAGDCASVYHQILKEPVYLPLATNANKQGKLIGEILSGKTVDYKGAIGSAFAKVLDREVGTTGITEQQALDKGFSAKSTLIRSSNLPGYYPNSSPLVLKLVYDEKTRQVLGGQFFGTQGIPARTNVLALCIINNMTVEEMQYMDLGYAPPFSHTWDIIHLAASAAK